MGSGGHARRFAEVIAILKDFGVTVVEPTSGSHWKLTKPGCRPYPIPAHNGPRSMIDWNYIAGACRHFGIDKSVFRSNN